jgi:hypothetical protein
MSWLNRDFRASKRAQNAQISAQSRQSRIHSRFPEAMQSVMDISQEITQAKQASMQC